MNQLKMNPNDFETYNTLGHILWKKKDLSGSKQCYEESLNKKKNKEALRNQSIILRSTGKDEENRKNIELSVSQAKGALMLDQKDPQSWCNIHNSHFLNFRYSWKCALMSLFRKLKEYKRA